jgi:hypothetical protein
MTTRSDVTVSNLGEAWPEPAAVTPYRPITLRSQRNRRKRQNFNAASRRDFRGCGSGTPGGYLGSLTVTTGLRPPRRRSVTVTAPAGAHGQKGYRL